MAQSTNGATLTTIEHLQTIAPLTPSGQVEKPDKKLEIHTSLSREYVADGTYGFYPYVRGLPHPFDDISTEFGVDVYERMMTDSEVSASIEVIKMATLANGYRVQPALQPQDDGYNMALGVAEFVSRCIEGTVTPFYDVMWQLMDALPQGSKVGELIYHLCDEGEDEGYLVLKDIKCKPNRMTVFAVDPYMNVIGLLASRIPGMQYPASAFIPLPNEGDPNKNQSVYRLLPRSKFVIFTWGMTNNDPRGRSALRPAYSAWWFKQQIIAEYLSWASKFASPSLVGETAPNAVAQTLLDVNGDPVLDVNGQPVCVTPEETLAQSLVNFRNGSAIGIPNGAKVYPIDTGNDGNAFAEAMRIANNEIVKAILKQTLATLEGKNQSRAASESHQDVLGLVILYVKSLLAKTIERDIFSKLVEYNFGKRAMKYVPKLQLGYGDGFSVSPEAIAKLTEAGFIHPSQYPEIDRMLGLPARVKNETATENRGEQLTPTTRNNA